MIEEFERHLRGTNLSENTISSYLFAIRQYRLECKSEVPYVIYSGKRTAVDTPQNAF